ncbi:MAG: hypothetical protein IJS12_03720 [Lachnospiraceae bacterium]|nr:hypothetical protein [Lachnospiraceae bacterium]
MKTRIAQKAIAAAMVVSMVATPLTAFATTQASSSGSSTAAVVAAETPSGSGAPSTPAPATAAVPANGNVSANGVKVFSTAAGVSTVKSVPAVVVTAPEADLTAALSLGKGEKAFASSYDITAKTAPNAVEAINEAAATQGATVVGMFNMTIGKMSGGQFKAADGSVRIRTSIIIPATCDPSKTYKVVVVSKGGQKRVEDDLNPDNGKVVAFNADGGIAAYALICIG